MSVVLWILGWFLHLPAALILFVAALADPQRRPRLSRVAVAVGATLSMVATVGWAAGIYHMALAPPDTFTVHTSLEFKVMEPSFRSIIEGDGSGIGFGADNVSYTGSGDGTGPILYVSFRTDLSSEE
ncbi:hypothetical protein [Micromonospora sp. NPDC000018]|uniref:hypothetical protein n=1 Tax=Micromonospora sp. NPDC000018 TaxID=3154239 RepID=UPI0033207497